MLFIKDGTSLQFVRFNRAGESLLGWSREALAAERLRFLATEQAEFFVEKDRETTRIGKVIDIAEEPIQTATTASASCTRRRFRILDSFRQTALPTRHLGGHHRAKADRGRAAIAADVERRAGRVARLRADLATVTRLAVQHVADWCAIDVWRRTGTHAPEGRERRRCRCRALRRTRADAARPRSTLLRPVRARGRTIRRSSSTHVSRTSSRSRRGRSTRKPFAPPGSRRSIAVPLLVRGKALGVLLFGRRNIVACTAKTIFRWAEALADRSAWRSRTHVSIEIRSRPSQLRNQVLGVVAHDLRSPLSDDPVADIGPSGVAGSERELGVIHRAATRMNRQIQDLLDVSLMEAGQAPPSRRRDSRRMSWSSRQWSRRRRSHRLSVELHRCGSGSSRCLG